MKIYNHKMILQTSVIQQRWLQHRLHINQTVIVLELSKLLKYEFFYHKLQPYYENKIKVHYKTIQFLLSYQ